MNNVNIKIAGNAPVGAESGARVPRYIHDLSDIKQIPEEELERLNKVASSFSFRATDYYLELIDWDDPDDPIRRLIIPHLGELDDRGDMDPSNESAVTPLHGVQHKYPDTALLLVNNTCAAYCRYCFRKRLFAEDNSEVNNDIDIGLAYIKDHPEISEILLTGGDPLLMSTRRISGFLLQISKIPHIKVLRFGSKTPAFNPWRLSGDPELADCLREFALSGKKIHLMTHFDHPRELTSQAVNEIGLYRDCGVIVLNQCPVIRGVNDDPEVLAELFDRLSWAGCAPYYLFVCRPTKGNEMYSVPIVEAHTIFHLARKRLSGLSKRARLVLSHSSGKIEIVGVDDERIYMRYHRAKDPADSERFAIFKRDDSAKWLDDLEEI